MDMEAKEHSCLHIENINKEEILKNLGIIRDLFIYKKRMIEYKFEKCGNCGGERQLACLKCAYVSCKDHLNHGDHFICRYLDEGTKLLISKHSKIIRDDQHYIGLRGIYNLYNTCFANCVMQAFLRLPIIRNFFLSGLYDCCDKRDKDCLLCQLFNLFQQVIFFIDQVNSGSNEVFCPNDIMTSVWKDSPQFSSGGQNDAHEFLICFIGLVRQAFIS
ncbi:Ubiquitin carboxyl-terminal hydrolase 22 [Thelohanellus kitauei]|uniref:Ubiquitin carboxyl-terminal hydrolase 22 n=1 Tax=Thelohanellus kitauei TaxID=669202 RepID=A0A0C2MLA9_THEKT|nr:Ubiquitin carboxyl-terminal hydrolase 22 [Thelohanellus kitauei]